MNPASCVSYTTYFDKVSKPEELPNCLHSENMKPMIKISTRSRK